MNRDVVDTGRGFDVKDEFYSGKKDSLLELKKELLQVQEIFDMSDGLLERFFLAMRCRQIIFQIYIVQSQPRPKSRKGCVNIGINYLH